MQECPLLYGIYAQIIWADKLRSQPRWHFCSSFGLTNSWLCLDKAGMSFLLHCFAALCLFGVSHFGFLSGSELTGSTLASPFRCHQGLSIFVPFLLGLLGTGQLWELFFFLLQFLERGYFDTLKAHSLLIWNAFWEYLTLGLTLKEFWETLHSSKPHTPNYDPKRAKRRLCGSSYSWGWDLRKPTAPSQAWENPWWDFKILPKESIAPSAPSHSRG